MNVWIEAMRLRTLPVSVAGVVGALAPAIRCESFRVVPAVLCLVFAVLAQIASNFANEYFDFRAGLDKAGRDGPRRGVTEGDISPRAMFIATLATLGAACVAGLLLLSYGPWWLLPAGVVIAAGALAYSAGPYPLSHHGLGELTVLVFFGLVPVTLTYLVTTGQAPDARVGQIAFAMGLMGANVLIVNNVRDVADDASVGKRTLAVIIGPTACKVLYCLDVAVAAVLFGLSQPWLGVIVAAIGAVEAWLLWRWHGSQLNRLLGMTAMLMPIAALLEFCNS